MPLTAEEIAIMDQYYQKQESSLTPEDIAILDQYFQEEPSVLEDVAKQIPSSIAEGVARAPLWAADTANAAVQGITRIVGAGAEALGYELSPEQAKALTYPPLPFHGSEEVVIDPLKEVGVEFRKPQTTAGEVTDVLGQIMGFFSAQKAAEKTATVAPKLADRLMGFIKDNSSGTSLKHLQSLKPDLTNMLRDTSSGRPNYAPQIKEDEAMRKVLKRLRADYPNDQDYLKAVNRYAYGDRALIEEAGKRTENLAQGSGVYPSGQAKAEEFFTKAVDKAPDTLKKSVSKNISKSTNYLDDVDQLLEKGRAKAAPLYEKAYKNNQQIESKVVDRILRTPEGQDAIKDAAKNMANKMSLMSKPDKELTSLAKELGSMGKVTGDTQGGVGRGFKLETLDQVKRSLDRAANAAAKREARGDNLGNEAARIRDLARGIKEELIKADKTGGYKRGLEVSGDYLSSEAAMEKGLKFLSADSEIVARDFAKFTPAEKRAFKVGVTRAIRSNIEKTTDGRNVTRIFNNEANRAKLKAILPDKEYNSLLSEAKAQDNIFKLRNKIVGNSQTAFRQIASEEFDEAGREIIESVARRGWINTTTDRVIGWISKRFDGLSDRMAGEVAEILYETDPKKKIRIIKSLVDQANKGDMGATRKLGAYYNITDEVSNATKAISGSPKPVDAPDAPKPKIRPDETSSNFDDAVNFVLKEEGGYVKNDAGKGETNYGINSSANPDIDVKNLTPEDAKSIYKERYWNALGADSLPRGLQMAAFDTAVNMGVPTAKELLKKADGDVSEFLRLRKKKYVSIAKDPSKKQYLKTWLNRVKRLEGELL